MNLRNLFKDASQWTKGADARTGNGDNVGNEDPLAVCWCLGGRLGGVDDEGPEWAAVRQAIREMFPERYHHGMVFKFNDHPDTTFADIQKVCDRAQQIMQGFTFTPEEKV